ncbi:conserved hypothetical protein [Microbacterium sp. 8M]|uniref:hypothetical protein n=1 Tax=Microbacterium sp. 8M TaxID=2653153 RepID=UPI0012F1DC0F|nr:hypothetical protein [Microbacterium sp. 8M]VXC12908.1 conserved hypothetical protein [Microbacterium sp. 8M]
MDVFERVREVNAGAGLTAEQIATARSRILGGIDDRAAVARKRASRRPMYLIAGGAVGVAAITTAVLVVNQHAAPAPQVEAVPAPTASPVPTPEPTPSPSPSPGTGAGTGIVEPFPGTTPQAGQYLEISSTVAMLRYRGPDTAQPYEWLFRDNYTSQPPISALLVQGQRSMFVPADRTAEWISVDGPQNERIRSFPDPQTAEDGQAWATMLPEDGGRKTVRDTGEALVGNYLWNRDYTIYPRDPQALLGYLRDFFAPTGSSREDSVATAIVALLRSNLAPPEVRRTFIDALAISGLATVESVDGSVTTYGIDITTVNPHRETVSIDATTGWVVQYTETTSRNDGGLVPTSIPDLRITSTVSIVDSAP